MMKLTMNEKTICGDIYFLQIVGDKIVLNDDYEGLCILDSNLQAIKKIKIIQDIVIYNSVVVSEKEVLLNCIENGIMFIVNIETDEIKKIHFPDMLKNEILLKMTKKEENAVILKTYKNHFYRMNIGDMTFERVDNDVYFDEEYNEECNDIENIKGYADYAVLDDIIVYMEEKKLLIFKGKEKHILLPDEGYYYIRVKLLDKSVKQLVVLSSRNDNSKCKILSYSFDK